MWIWILASMAAFYIKGLCGFANTLIFDAVMGFGADNVNISPVELVLGYPSNIVLTWKNRKKLDFKIFAPLAALVLAGSVPGAMILKYFDAGKIKVLFGVIIILLGIEMYFRERNNSEMKENKAVLTIIGLASGVLCGLFGIGALLAAYIGRVTRTGDAFKANICAVFIAENTFRIALYTFMGIITAETLKQSLILMPFMALGLFGGMLSSKILNESKVKKLVIVLLVLSGAVLIVKNI